MLTKDVKHGGARGKGSSLPGKLEDVSSAYVSQARFVLRNDGQIAQSAATANLAVAPQTRHRVAFQIGNYYRFQPYDLSVRLEQIT